MGKWINRAGALSLTLAVGLASGCGDSIEHRLARAQISLSHGKPDEALKMADSVLSEQPDNLEAQRFKAAALIQRAETERAREALDALLAKHPDSPEAHRLRSDWAFARMRELLNRSEFTADAAMQASFDEAMTVGAQEVDWLERRAKKPGEAPYLRGRYALWDADRTEALLRVQRATLRREGDGEAAAPGTPATSPQVKQLEAERATKRDAARKHLVTALEENPAHFDAAALYANLLKAERDWPAFWALAQSTSEQKDLPATLYENLVLGVVAMPESVHKTEERRAVTEKLRDNLVKGGADHKGAKLATAWSHLVLARDPAKAQPLVESVLRSEPNHQHGRYLMGQCLFQQGKYAEARRRLDKLATEPGMNRDPRVQLLYGMALWKSGDPELAKDPLRRAADADPNNPAPREALMELIRATQGASGLAAVRQEIVEAYRQNPANPKNVSMRLKLEQGEGRREAVAEVLAEVERVHPRGEELTEQLIDGYFYLNRYDKAERFAQDLVKMRPDSLDANLKLAEAKLMRGEEKDVKGMLAALQTRFPEAPAVDQLMGRLYLQRQNFDKAVELLAPAVEKNPGDAEARLMLARAYASVANMEDALEQINAVLETEPDNTAAHALAARVYQFMQRPDDEARHLEQIDENKVDVNTNPALAAQLRLRKGTPEDVEAAANIANRALAAGHTDPALRMILANIYARNKEPALLEETLMSLARTQPNNAQAYLQLARFYQETKQVERGLNQLSTLQTGNEAWARLGQAQLLISAGRGDEAIAQLDPLLTALVKDKRRESLVIAESLARLHLAKRDGNAAYAVFERLRKADFLVNEATLRQIELTAAQDGPEATVKKLDELAAKLTPEQSRLRYQLIRRYAMFGKVDRSMELLDQWIADRPDVPTLRVWKAEALQQLKREPEAVAVLQETAKLVPDDVGVQRRLAQAHMANGDYPAAEAVFRGLTKSESGARLTALASLGQMYLGLGLDRQAAAAFEELERTGRTSDPRLLYAIGQAYNALGQKDTAAQRLAAVPNYAPQYAPAQILLARIDQARGKAEDAKKRLQDLARDPRYLRVAAGELVKLNLRNKQDEELIRWSDEVLGLEQLPTATRVRWLEIRAAVAAERKDWKELLVALEQIARLDPKSAPVAGARVAVLLHMNRREEAGQIARETPAFKEGRLGAIMAAALGETVKPPADDKSIGAFVALMGQRDAAAARSVAEGLEPYRTVFRGDLVAVAGRPDAGSAEMAEAHRKLAVALIALGSGVPAVAEAASEEVIGTMPHAVLAHALVVQARLDQEKPIDDTLRRVERTLPQTVLAAFLASHGKELSGDYAGAAEGLKALVEKEPHNPHVRFTLAQALQKAGKPDEAIEQLRLLATDGPYRTASANDLAYLLAQRHPEKLEEAYALASEASKQRPEFAPLQDTLGWIEHLRKNDAAAVKLLSEAVTRLRDVPEVHLHLGLVYKALGQEAWAGYHLDKAAESETTKEEASRARQALGK